MNFYSSGGKDKYLTGEWWKSCGLEVREPVGMQPNRATPAKRRSLKQNPSNVSHSPFNHCSSWHSIVDILALCLHLPGLQRHRV